MGYQPDVNEYRKPTHPISDLFWQRWSPRAMSGEPVDRAHLMRLLEAARWAPSAFNAQPWRFVYALRETEHWPRLFDLMGEFNQGWTAKAGALVLVLSRRLFEHNGASNRTHAFDTGAAWQNLALQGTALGLVVHGMAGFDYDRAREISGLTDVWNVEMMFAVGHPGDPADLPDSLRERELPSERKPLSEIVFEGRFDEGSLVGGEAG